jgi:hypothetical protein
MNNVLDSASARPADPILSVRKAPHAQVWSVWASLEGTDAEEIFEGSSEQEALDWIAAALLIVISVGVCHSLVLPSRLGSGLTI